MSLDIRNLPAEVKDRAAQVRVLLMDVDGVLTDGRIYLVAQPEGEATEMKVFSAHDGAGLKMARIAGLRTGVITGRESSATTRRAREVDMEFVYQGVAEKLAAYRRITRSAQRPYYAEREDAGDSVPITPGRSRHTLPQRCLCCSYCKGRACSQEQPSHRTFQQLFRGALSYGAGVCEFR